MSKLVGVTGFAGSGKSTIARMIGAEYPVVSYQRFAGPIKAALRAIGLSDEELDGTGKGQPCELLCGNTPRYAMQTLGTEWGRKLIGETIWVKAVEKRCVELLSRGWLVIIDDVRFPNEAEMIQRLGGVLVKVTRPGIEQMHHESEHHIGAMRENFLIENDSDLAALKFQIQSMCMIGLEAAE